MYKLDTPELLELARRITELQGEVNRLNVIFEHNRESNGKIISALQKDVDEVKHPDIHYQVVRRA